MPWTKFAAPLLLLWLLPDSLSKCCPGEASSGTSVDRQLHEDDVPLRLQIPITISLQQCVSDALYSCAAFLKHPPGIMKIFEFLEKPLEIHRGVGDGIIPFGLLYRSQCVTDLVCQ